MKVEYEMTDTFGGEANYYWVERGIIDVPENASKQLITRRVKATLGITGVRCRRSDFGDTVRLDLIGCNVVAFIF